MKENGEDSTSNYRYWDLLTRYLRPHLAILVVLLALILMSIGFQLVIPQITRNFITYDKSPSFRVTHKSDVQIFRNLLG